MIKNHRKYIQLPVFLFAATMACGVVTTATAPMETETTQTAPISQLDRLAVIPTDAEKMSPQTDEHPPMLYSDEFEPPVPVPGEINTAGAEDGAFILPDGKTFFFFFTPDVDIPVEKQLLDGVTGLYVSKKENGDWGKAERIVLQDPGKLALDGCEFIEDNLMWFCSAREGYVGIHWFTAELINGTWINWQLADFSPEYEVGELHFTRDQAELYFHSSRPGGKGGLDIWVSKKLDGQYHQPVNVEVINTADDEGWPALNPGEDELWFNRNYGIWRSKKVNGEWQTAELIVSPLAGEPTVDDQGNLYFVHHFYRGDQMIEADIYVAYKK